MNELEIGKQIASIQERLDKLETTTKRNTLFPVSVNTDLEFRRFKEILNIPIGSVLYYYGNHNSLPYGWRSLNDDLRLSKIDYQNLYLTIKDSDKITEQVDYFIIDSLQYAIIRVI